MAESVFYTKEAPRSQRYEELLPQVKAILEGEENQIAREANFVAILKEVFDFFWVGFYHVDTSKQLVLGPFQGPLACMRINYGRGVCGTAWEKEKTLIVDNVTLFPGHIACSSVSQSEIVIPYYNKGELAGVLDIDSEHLDYFNEADKEGLERLLKLLDR